MDHTNVVIYDPVTWFIASNGAVLYPFFASGVFGLCAFLLMVLLVDNVTPYSKSKSKYVVNIATFFGVCTFCFSLYKIWT